MDNRTQASDQPVLNHIQELVTEEHQLYQQGERGRLSETDRQKLAKAKLNWISAGISLGNAEPFAALDWIQTWHRFGRRR